MCIADMFKPKGDPAAQLTQQLQLAQAEQSRKAAEAALAQSNMDTESSRLAAESAARRAQAASGFGSTVKAGANDNSGGSVVFKQLFGS